MQPVTISLFAQRLSKTGLPVQVSLNNSRALMPTPKCTPAKIQAAPAKTYNHFHY
jgi:hypothetical protein